jgi:hypothetical protein
MGIGQLIAMEHAALFHLAAARGDAVADGAGRRDGIVFQDQDFHGI